MNTFKKKSLIAALAGAGALVAAGAAEAVAIGPEGTGEVLIYPYYTVRAKVGNNLANFNSLISVVNSTASAKAVKVRFIEGKASQEVLDFNLFLSAHDVWTAAVVPTLDGAGIRTTDKSCTLPEIPSVGVPFVNFAYDGDPVEDDSLDRTREGYVEIIEMGAIYDDTATWSAVTHSKGVPNCSKLPSDAQITADIFGNTGGLFGGVSLINVLSGEDITADAVALEGFDPGGNLYQPPGDVLPNLASGFPFSQTLYNDPFSVLGVAYVYAYWADPVDAVSAVMMRNTVMNEFVLDTGTKSGTDWVVTMPTKRYYYDSDGVVQKLFQRNLGKSGACDDVNLTQYDREEQGVSTPQSFSPPPPTPKSSICWEANVITFNNSDVLASTNRANLPTAFEHGWVSMSFPTGASSIYSGDYHTLVGFSDPQLASPDVTFVGLPVVGFAAQTFNNGVLSDAISGSLLLSNYGGNFIHKYTTQVNFP